MYVLRRNAWNLSDAAFVTDFGTSCERPVNDTEAIAALIKAVSVTRSAKLMLRRAQVMESDVKQYINMCRRGDIPLLTERLKFKCQNTEFLRSLRRGVANRGVQRGTRGPPSGICAPRRMKSQELEELDAIISSYSEQDIANIFMALESPHTPGEEQGQEHL